MYIPRDSENALYESFALSACKEVIPFETGRVQKGGKPAELAIIQLTGQMEILIKSMNKLSIFATVNNSFNIKNK